MMNYETLALPFCRIHQSSIFRADARRAFVERRRYPSAKRFSIHNSSFILLL